MNNNMSITILIAILVFFFMVGIIYYAGFTITKTAAPDHHLG